MKDDRKPQIGLRLPPDLKRWLEEQAAQNHRSLNGEIVVRLERSQHTDREQTTSR